MIATILLFIVIILSGDALAVIHNGKFGEVTPVTIFGAGMVLYFFGIFENFFIGFVLLICLTGLIYAYCVGYLFFHKNHIIAIIKNYFNLTFASFVVVCIILLIGDYNQQATHSDDLEHWVDCVKVMTYSNKFYTAEQFSPSSFSTYPPFGGLIQYIAQAIQRGFFKGQFVEWLNFFVYHLCLYAIWLPVLSHAESRTKNVISVGASSIIALLLPTLLFPNIFKSTMIDPLLSVTAGVVFAIIIEIERIKYSELIIILSLVSLVLMKDLGLLFASFGLLLLIEKTYRQKRYYFCIISAISVIATKISWMTIISRYHAVDPKPNSVNWIKYIKVLLGFGTYEEAYKNEVVKRFRTLIFKNRVEFGGIIRISLPFFFLMLIALAVTAMLVYLDMKYAHVETVFRSLYFYNVIIITLMIFVFWFGLGGVYVDKFIETESVAFASHSRYFNTIINSVSVETIVILIINKYDWKLEKYVYYLTIMLFFIIPYDNTLQYIKQDLRLDEESSRSDANLFANEMKENCKTGSKVYIVSQNERGWFDYLVGKLMVRPLLAVQSTANNDYNWCFVEEADPNDIYSKQMSNEQWAHELFDNNEYDYVAISHVDDYFNKEFADMFESNIILEKAIYEVDRKERKLDLVFVEK